MPHDQLEAVYRGIHAETVAAACELMARYNFLSARHLVDVGGGSGGLAFTVAAACPHLRATVVDLPTVTLVTRRYVEEAGLAHRVHVLPADVVRGPLTGVFDVAVLLRLIQVLSPDQARRMLRNVSQVVEPDGVLYIIGQVLDNTRVSPPEVVAANRFFLNAFEAGQAYTEQEHRDWLAEVGFERVEHLLLPNHMSIMRARKPR
jgi:cyclopropane fatty-acyl-phospholipid synthase-like methyltransferase